MSTDYFTNAKERAQKGRVSDNKLALLPAIQESIKHMSPEQKEHYLTQLLLKQDYRVEGDSNAVYRDGTQQIEVVPEHVLKAFDSDKNQWAKVLKDRPMDYKYNIEMLDPDYAAWYAAKKGKVAYKADINRDGTDDVFITNPAGTTIEWYNGYRPTKSNQRIALNYHKRYDPTGITKSGAPIYTDRPSLSEFYAENSRDLEQLGKLESTNKAIKGGLKKWVARDKTVTDLVKDKWTKEYYADLLQKTGYTEQQYEIIKKVIPVNRFRSLITTAVMGLLGKSAGIKASDARETVSKLNSHLNKKVPKGITNPFMPIKQKLCDAIENIGKLNIKIIVDNMLAGMTQQTALNNLIKGLNSNQVFWQNTAQLVENLKQIINANNEITQIRNANRVPHAVTGKRIQPYTERARKSFNPQDYQNAINLDDN